MAKVKIVADSTCDLSDDLVKAFDISILPLYVNIGGRDYRDRMEIDQDKLFELVSEYKVLPKTASISYLDFEEHLAPWYEKGYDVIFICISSELSATYQNACTYVSGKGWDRAYVVDSRNLSTGVGHVVLKAAELAQTGMSGAEVVEALKTFIPRVNSSFVIDTMEYLHKGGRCSTVQAVAGSVLKLHPQIDVVDGKMTVADKIKGKRRRCLDTYYRNKVTPLLTRIDPHRIFVTHTASDGDAEYLAERLKADKNFENVHITRAGSVISSHCGPGTIGILFITND